MIFGVVSVVGRGMGILDWVVIVEGEGTVLGVNLGRPIVTSWDGDALFPNYFGEYLFTVPRAIVQTPLVLFVVH